MNIQQWNMFFNHSIFLHSAENWDKKLQVIFSGFFHTFSMTNDQHETNLMVMTRKAFRKKKKKKVLTEYLIISDILLLTLSYNYFFNIFPCSKSYGLEVQEIFQNYSLMSYLVSGPQRINVIFESFLEECHFYSCHIKTAQALSCKGQNETLNF